MTPHTYDAIIIGFGKGGKTLAVALAAAGWRVAMIERSKKMYGGTCINIACIPTKTLASAAEHGLSFDDAMARKETVVTTLNHKNFHMLADRETVTVLDGVGSFVDSATVRVTAGSDQSDLTAGAIFIDTGAAPNIPAIDGVRESSRVYTSTGMLELASQPARLAVVGGGYVGLEFASTCARFGSAVTVFNRGEAILRDEDPPVARAVTESLEEQGIRLVHNARVERVRDTATGVEVVNCGTATEFDAVLLATGRRPVTDDLNLAAARVETTDRGAIAVNERLQTTQPHIWAMGDVIGGPQFTYTSLDDFRIVRSQVLGDGSYTLDKRKPIAFSVFLQTPLARVGMTEGQAIDAGRRVAVNELPVASIPRALLDDRTEGLLRAVVDRDTNLILGATLFCQQAHEIVNIIKTAIDNDLPYTVLRDQVFTHPTMAEALNDLFAM
jgi:pyruvate/2-oxoglutarate dehydrogenase complex dihydrolipoamide dehydrogenase (E3) component